MTVHRAFLSEIYQENALNQYRNIAPICVSDFAYKQTQILLPIGQSVKIKDMYYKISGILFHERCLTK